MVATQFYGCDEPDTLRGPVRRSRGASDPRDLVGRVSALLPRARLEPRAGVGRRRRSVAGQAHHHPGLAGHGLGDQPGFRRYHEALSRARWDSREVARRLLMHLLAVLWPSGEVVIAIDDTIERRWGAKIKARGIFRDPVRSSRGMFVKTSGLRWLSLAVMSPFPSRGSAGRCRSDRAGALGPMERGARQAARDPSTAPVRPFCRPNVGWRIARSSWSPTAASPRWS